MQAETAKVSLWYCFRLVFVILFLYLLQDVFFRYDGVSYYSTISNFLPSIALVSIFWSIAAGLVAILIWLFLWAFEWFCHKIEKTINTENLLLFVSIMLSIGIIIWVGRRSFSSGVTSSLLKLATLLFAIIVSLFITWILRGKLCIIQQRITPLVWMFGIIVIVSVPVVTYSVGIKHFNKTISHEGGYASAVDKNKPNIILVTFDALTARDMSVYGYNRPTTLFIDKWSKEAHLFTRAEADGNYTFPTTLSLMTGQRAWTHKQFNPHGHKFTVTPENFARVLKNNNYYNIAYIQNPLASLSKLGIEDYFDLAPSIVEFKRPGSILGLMNDFIYYYIGDSILLYDWITKDDFLLGMFWNIITSEVYVTQYPSNRVFDEILSVISGNSPEPFFIWAHLNIPHSPYLPPEQYIGVFSSSSMLKTQKEQNKYTGYGEDPEIRIEQAIIDVLRARYDEFIRYCDDQFEYFITQLQKSERSNNTIIILSADHGESFEHDYITHGGNELYEAVTHIPLLIKEPGQTEGRVIHDLVSQIDISATILDLADIPVPSWMEGQSLKPLMRGQELSARPVFSMSLYKNPILRHKITKGTYAVREGDYKLIHRLEQNESLLFNLSEDPGELNNIIDKNPANGIHLLGIIKENLKRANERMARED